MELATRRVHFAGCTPNPDEEWMLQVARNLSDAEEGFLHGTRCLLMDRDAKFSEAFRVILEQAGVNAVRLPPRSPNLTPNLERFMRSVKDECLHRLIFFGEAALLKAVREFVEAEVEALRAEMRGSGRATLKEKAIGRIPASHAMSLDFGLPTDIRRRILLPGRQGCKDHIAKPPDRQRA